MREPSYEIWTLDPARPSDDAGAGRFAEDVDTFDEAIKAVREYQDTGLAAWVKDKNTGLNVEMPTPAVSVR